MNSHACQFPITVVVVAMVTDPLFRAVEIQTPQFALLDFSTRHTLSGSVVAFAGVTGTLLTRHGSINF